MNIEDSCHRFFTAEREFVRGYRSGCVASGIEGQQRVGFASASQTNPKRIQVSDKNREPAKIYTKVQPPRFICGVNLKSQA